MFNIVNRQKHALLPIIVGSALSLLFGTVPEITLSMRACDVILSSYYLIVWIKCYSKKTVHIELYILNPEIIVNVNCNYNKILE